MADKAKQLAYLKQHFRRRVYDQARSLVGNWANLRDSHWNETWFNGMVATSEKIQKLSARYESDLLSVAATELTELLVSIGGTRAPKSETLETIDHYIQQIARYCSRANDELPLEQISEMRKPVYLAFPSSDVAKSIELQLGHFGMPTETFFSVSDLQQAIHLRRPAAIIMDTQFDKGSDIEISSIQQTLRTPVPIFFLSHEEPSMSTRLAVIRANGVSLAVGQLDMAQLVEQMSDIYSMRTEPPLRVLVVDDSISQSTFAEKTLNSAGIFTRALNKPLEVMNVIREFQPDVILMDMYMPEVDGPELARVIRQIPLYDAVPILYLSAEADVEKQMDALGQGGDDFLIKPVAKGVLITTVVNRCRRYRGLKEQMIRDGLTGLLDHNNTLLALEQELQRSQTANRVVTFAMIDIDKFKSINDVYGHSMGDRVIHSLALYLRQRFRVTDSLGRYGGEEFAVVLPTASEQIAKRILDEVREGFESLIHYLGEDEVSVTFSCGIAQWDGHEDVLNLTQRADSALYRAKRNGRNRVEVSSENTQDDHS